jgi:hypothetical protein
VESSGEERIRRFAEIETLIRGQELQDREARRPLPEIRLDVPTELPPLAP